MAGDRWLVWVVALSAAPMVFENWAQHWVIGVASWGRRMEQWRVVAGGGARTERQAARLA